MPKLQSLSTTLCANLALHYYELGVVLKHIGSFACCLNLPDDDDAHYDLSFPLARNIALCVKTPKFI